LRATTLGIGVSHTVPSIGMKVYERETSEILNRFLSRRLSFAECIAALGATLADLIPTLTGDEIARLRMVMLANNEIVMKEMERRSREGELTRFAAP